MDPGSSNRRYVAAEGQQTIGRLTNEAGGIAMPSGATLNYLNQFVDDQFTDVPPEQNLSFRGYMERQNEVDRRTRQIEIANARRQPVTAKVESTNSAQYTKLSNRPDLPYVPLPPGPNPEIPVEVKKKAKPRYVCLNSNRRNELLYPNIADCKIELPKTYTNVTQLRIAALQFPNVGQAITEANNKIYWINKEDVDLGFPVYQAEIHRGSYRLQTIQAEMESRLNTVEIKRRGGAGVAHYFIITADYDTDYFSLTSILATQAPTNAVQTFQGTGVIRINQTAHGYQDNERIHVIGVRGLVGGIQSSYINGAYNINRLNDDAFSFEIAQIATESTQAGGTLIKTGRESEWQLLGGQYRDSIVDRLGFRSENSSENVPVANPLTSIVKAITGVQTGYPTRIICPDHGLQTGDRVYLYNTFLSPSIYGNDLASGDFTVTAVVSTNAFEIPFSSSGVYNITEAYVGTQILSMNFPNHRFNKIVSIEQAGPGVVEVTTLLDHGFTTGDSVRISESNAIPTIDSYYTNITVIGPDTFQVNFAAPITSAGFDGILTTDHTFYLYGVEDFGGFRVNELNHVPFRVREVIDADNFTFAVSTGFANKIETGGGSSVRINSKLHGWAGTHDNSPSGVLNKPIDLSGDNYAYLCMPNIPQEELLETVDPVKNVVTQIYLTTIPGYVIFNEYFDKPIDFADKPLARLDEVHFQFRNPDGILLDFNGLDWSCILEITESVQMNERDREVSRPIAGGASGAVTNKRIDSMGPLSN